MHYQEPSGSENWNFFSFSDLDLNELLYEFDALNLYYKTKKYLPT